MNKSNVKPEIGDINYNRYSKVNVKKKARQWSILIKMLYDVIPIDKNNYDKQ